MTKIFTTSMTGRVSKLLFFLACIHSGTFTTLAQEHKPDDVVALALGDGGFLSVAEMTGLTSGLRSDLMKYNCELLESDNALVDYGLFNRVESINSISGGSWFAARLAYSKDFRATIEKVAKQQVNSAKANAALHERKKTINEVKKAYNRNDIYLKLIEDGRNNPLGMKLTGLTRVLAKIESIIKKSPIEVPEGTLQTIGLIGTLLDKGFFGNLKILPIQWFDAGTKILDDIPGSTTFGDPVQDWSKGKKWRIIVSVATPNVTNTDRIFDGGLLNYLKYNVDSDPPSRYIPARFSATLGYPDKSADVYDTSGLLSTYKVEYKGKNFPFEILFEKKWAESPQGINATLNSHGNFKDMPLIGPVSASSAFVGADTFNPELADVFEDFRVDPNVYYAPKLTGKDAFDEPQAIMRKVWQKKDPNKENASDLAKNAAHVLTDGGIVDNFGIATAVATNATNVFVVDVASFTNLTWKTHFQGADVSPVSLKGFSYDVWNIFEEDWHYANETEKKFHKLTVDQTNTEILEGITYGTVHATTRSQKNNYFGIKGCRKVKLTIFQVDVCLLTFNIRNPNPNGCGKGKRKKGISIGVNQDFEDYGLLVAEITDALYDHTNKIHVDQMLSILSKLKKDSTDDVLADIKLKKDSTDDVLADADMHDEL